MKLKIRSLDIFIILLSASFVIFSAYSAYVKPKGDLSVQIRGKSQWSFPLEARETVAVSGPLGDTVIKIDQGRAWVESSPCAGKTCVAAGFASKRGQWAACLPNKVFFVIEGKEGAGVDTVVW
jgi:hypothetical protein